MKHTLKTAKTMMPVALSTLVLVGAAPQVAIAAQNTQSTPVSNVLSGGGYRDDDSSLPPVRETLTQKEAEDLPGCEAYFDSAKHEFVIRPKNGASEGVISYSLENKKADFEAIRNVLIFKGDSDEVPVRFDKRVYIYDSTNPSANDTLFYQVHVKTINITPNLSIKFAKNLATFFMQNYNKDADHLHYIKGVENWDTSHVESMEKMFNLASQLEGKLDLSKWDVSGADKLNLMFSGVGNDSFVLDFSNKKFKNSADVTNMFNSFRGVLVANGWTLVDPNGTDNPIQKLVDNSSNMLTHWDASAHAYIGPSLHLLITDNPTILEKNKTEKYKFYKKVKVIYKVNGTEKSVEVELPAVYDSRIDADGKPDVNKTASSDPMKVVRPQIDAAIKQAVKDLRAQNPTLNLPENVIPVPVHDLKNAKSPIELFQDYYLGLVTEETIKAKTTYTADPSLNYQQVVTDTKAIDGKKQVITGKMVDGVWQADATDEKEISAVVEGKARVGNKKVETEDIQPGTVYEADGTLNYKQEQPTEGTKGTKTTTTTYEVNSETGLTDKVEGEPKVETKAAKDKVIKVGNVKKEKKDVAFKTRYVADGTLTYKAQKDKATGQNGSKTVTTTYKVNKTSGLTADVESTKEETTTNPTDHVISVGNKEVKTEDIQPGTTYEADSSLEYNKQQTTEGTKGTKTTTTIYKVDENNGLTSNVDGTPTVDTVKAKDKVIKVGNVEKKTNNIAFKKTYVGNPDLTYQKQETKTAGKNGKEEVTLTYKVDAATGLTTEVEAKKGLCTKPVNEVVQVGNKEVIQNNDGSTTTKIYKVNPDDGTLSDPTVVTSRPWTDIAGGASVSEVLKGKMTYTADDSLPYGQTQKVSDPKDGEKTTTPTGKVENGKWVEGEPKVETKAAVNGVTKVGNKKVETEDIQPATVYQADSKLDYKKEQTSEGTKGTKTTTTIYVVDADTGLTKTVQSTESKTTTAATDKVVKVGNVDSKVKVIKFTTTYVNDDTLPEGTEQIITKGQDGSEKVVTTYKVDPTNGLTTQVEKTETIDHKDPVTQVVHKGTKKNTPEPTPVPPVQHDSSAPAVTDTQEAEVLPGKMKYEADDTLPYNTQKKISDPVEGLKVTTHTGKFVNSVWVPSEKVEITDARDGLTKVGNKQVTHDGNKTITTTYDVDPDTGELTNPQTHTSMSWSELISAKPVAPDTDHHESDNSGDNTGTNAGDNAGTNSDANAGTNAATDAPALLQPKHMKQTPKTGDTGSFGSLLSSLGLSLLGFATLRKKKH